MIGGLAIILVFCFMIGLLILEPGTKEQDSKRNAIERRRKAEAKQIAAKSWLVQPERLEN